MALASYEHSGGYITAPRPYGVAPLAADYSKRDVREEAFHQRFSFENSFESAVNGNGTPFKNAFFVLCGCVIQTVSFQLGCA